MSQGAWRLRRAALGISAAVVLCSGVAGPPLGRDRAAYATPAGAAAPGSTSESERPAVPPGASRPAAALLDAQILDLDDKPVLLRGMHGKVVVVLHQDRYSSDQNQGFKDRLGELVLRFPGKLQLIALAEAGGYNFWPARGYVKDALKPLRALGGALVACDWKGAVKRSYSIPARQSAVFVVDKDSTLQALRVGVLPAADAAALLERIAALAGE